MPHRFTFSAALIALSALSVLPASALPGTYRMRTAFTGHAKCLDIVNDGWNNRVTMASCGYYSGQAWIVEPNGIPGHWRLRTEFTGHGKCLDIVNDGTNNRLTMATCGNYT